MEKMFFLNLSFKLACIVVLETTIKSKKYHFAPQFSAFFQQSASPLYYALVDELHDNFETINAGKQELDSLNFVLM